MERGKLSAYTFKDRAHPTTPYYQLQRWEHGQNGTRYLPVERVPSRDQALAGPTQLQALVEQNAPAVIARTREQLAAVGKKKNLCQPLPHLRRAPEPAVAQGMARFQAQAPTGQLVQELEGLVRTAIFQPANALVGPLLPAAADQPQPGQACKERVRVQIQGLFGHFELPGDYC